MGDNTAGSIMVAADAQFSVARILKPFPGFERVYQGVSYASPIAFPGGADDRAGQEGIAPNLMKGTPVPFGARLLVYIPVALTEIGGQGVALQQYNYSFIWRLRNVRDFRQDRRPYHFPRQSPGAPDGVAGEPRFVIPAAIDTIIYEQAEPSAAGEKAIQRAYQQTYTVGLGFEPGTRPLLPGGVQGIYQQGVLNPADVTALGAGGALFTPLWMDAAGDELIIIANRTTPSEPPPPGGNWDFTLAAQDLAFSDVYGTGNGSHEPYPDVGIYLFTGTNP